ncbi:MAG: aldolase [Actinomycetota bacterium]|nr:aldolase [Actinomycetota bacterium]
MTEHPRPRRLPGGVELADSLTAMLDPRLAEADAALAAGFPGDSPDRQPVHTVYVSADLFSEDLAGRWGRAALASVDQHPGLFAEVAGTDQQLISLVRQKLASEPIEDVRIDFEDGYGARGDDVEDADVLAAAAALARATRAGTAPPFRGIRFKSLEAATRRRGVRTLTMFLSRLLEEDGTLEGFAVTLPKITSVEQVEAMVDLTGRLEDALGLVARSLRFELQIETPQSILGPDGTALVARMIHAGDRRVTALHYGTYDYSAFCGIPAPQQSMEHPVADHAKLVMQAAAAGTGVRLSDGSTNVLPLGDDRSVRHGWELHARLVGRSLERGYYQGWDLHPAQLPTRFAATYAFFREGFPQAAERLRSYLEQTGSNVLDEPATARALSDFVLRGVDCGAISAAEVESSTGLDTETVAALARPQRM